MRGFAPRRENDFAGLGAPYPDMRDRELIWGFAPCPDREVIIYAGFHPAP